MSESKPRTDGSFIDPSQPGEPDNESFIDPDVRTEASEPHGEPVEIPLASETGTASVEVDAPMSLDDVFVRWFLRFNTHDPEAPAKGMPSPRSVSWERAGEIIVNAGLGARAVDVLQRCVCWTRHMHTGPMELDAGWLESGQYEIDTERFRARPHRMTDAPQNWFAVETDEVHLRGVVDWFLENDQGGDDVVGSPLAGPLSVDQLREHIGHAPPKSAQDYKDDADTMQPSHLGAKLPSGAPAPDPGRLGEWAFNQGMRLASQDVAEVDPVTGADSESFACKVAPHPSDANCPPGYQILVTPEGHYVAAWYSPPRRSEAEVVADAWKHSTQGK